MSWQEIVSGLALACVIGVAILLSKYRAITFMGSF